MSHMSRSFKVPFVKPGGGYFRSYHLTFFLLLNMMRTTNTHSSDYYQSLDRSKIMPCFVVLLYTNGEPKPPNPVTTGSGLTERRFCHVAIVSSSPKRRTRKRSRRNTISLFFNQSSVEQQYVWFLKKIFQFTTFQKEQLVLLFFRSTLSLGLGSIFLCTLCAVQCHPFSYVFSVCMDMDCPLNIQLISGLL